MLITFKTDAYANITMFGDIGKTMLRLMEHNHNIPGAILADDVADALNNLKRNITSAPGNDSSSESQDEDEPQIALNKRAMPLIELLEAAVKSHVDIRWDQGC